MATATASTVTLKAALGVPLARPCTYRRSTNSRRTVTNRKRFFVSFMEKHSPGIATTGAGSMISKASAASGNAKVLLACCGGDNNDAGAGGNNNNNAGGRPPRGPGGNSSGGQPVPRALVLGAAALMAALVLLPSQQAAASGSPAFPRAVRVAGASSASAGAAPGSPRSLCLNHKLPALASNAGEGVILYGHVQLTDAERRLLARSSRQIFFSECVRVGSGRV